MEYPILYEEGDNLIWSFKTLGDDSEEEGQIIFRPYIPTHRKKETKATIIEKLPSTITKTRTKVYLDGQADEIVTVLDLNPEDEEDDDLCGVYGWCKIRAKDGYEGYFLISFLKFNENF